MFTDKKNDLDLIGSFISTPEVQELIFNLWAFEKSLSVMATEEDMGEGVIWEDETSGVHSSNTVCRFKGVFH